MAGLQGYIILLFAAMALSAHSMPQQTNISGLDIITSVHVDGNEGDQPVNKNETVKFGKAVHLQCRAAIKNGSIERVTWYRSIDKNNASSPYLSLSTYSFTFKKLIVDENTTDESNVYINRFTDNFEGYYYCVVRANGMYMSQLVRVSLKRTPDPDHDSYNNTCSIPKVVGGIKLVKHMLGVKYDNNTEGMEYNNVTLQWSYDPSNSTEWCRLGNFAIRYSVWDDSLRIPAPDSKISGYDEYNWSQWQSVQRGSTEFYFPFISTTLYYLFQVAIPRRHSNPHSEWYLEDARLYDSNVIFNGHQKGAKITQILPSETLNVSVGTPVALKCEHEGYPRPKVYWTRQVGGFNVDIDDFNGSDVYRIDYAQPYHSGIYQCLAWNIIITDFGKTTQNDFKSATLSVYQESEKCVSFHSETCSGFHNGTVLSKGQYVLQRMNNIASDLNGTLMDYTQGERNETCVGYIREMYCRWAMPSCTHNSTSRLCQASCLRIVNECKDLWTIAVKLLDSSPIEWPKCSDLTDDDTCVPIVMEPVIRTPTTTVEPKRPTMKDDVEQQIIGVIIGAGILLLLIAMFAISVAIYCRCSIPKISGELKPIEGCTDIGLNLVCNPNYHKVRELIGITDKDLEEWNHILHADIAIIGEIGQGNFGKVFKAEVKGISLDDDPVIVAAKKLFDCEAENSLKLFLHEAKIMSHLNHPNIVRLYGVCLSYAPYYLLFEYMTEGDLNAFLRQRASSELRRLMNEKTASSRTESALSNDPAELTNEQLLFVCIQVARGMSHLANCNLLHRDLATRNCLVGDNLTVKIGDFGMSQNLYHHDYYRVHGEVPLPVRWMPPESIIYGKFTSETDVWAFGVVMWEVFSFAMQPYFGHTNEEVCDLVRSGVTLKCPENCPPKVFNLMQMCWSAAPDNRPTMQDLCGQLEVLLKNQMDSPIPYRDSQSLSSNDSEVSNVFETPIPSPGPGCAIHSPSDDSDMEP